MILCRLNNTNDPNSDGDKHEDISPRYGYGYNAEVSPTFLQSFFTPKMKNTSRTSSARHSPKSTSPHLPTVELLLSSKTPEEGLNYLKHTVADLLHEVEKLKLNLERSQLERAALQIELENQKLKDRPRIDVLIQSLHAATDGTVKVSVAPDKRDALTGAEAAALAVTTLTSKLGQLSAKNLELTGENLLLYEKIQELCGENEARNAKIEALEIQFKSINKSRQRVVQRLNSNLAMGEAAAPSVATTSTTTETIPSPVVSPVEDTKYDV